MMLVPFICMGGLSYPCKKVREFRPGGGGCPRGFCPEGVLSYILQMFETYNRAVCQKVVYLLFKLRQCLKYCLSVNWYARSLFKFKPCLTSLKHPKKLDSLRGMFNSVFNISFHHRKDSYLYNCDY